MANPTADRSYAEAVQFYRRGQLRQAETALLAALHRTPGDAAALHFLGVICLQKGEVRRALQLLQQAVKAAPDNGEYLANLGNALREAGQPDQAAAICRRAIELKPSLVYAHNNLGNALVDLGQPLAAAETFRRAIALQPGLAALHGNLGNALLQAGQPEPAAIAFRRAGELQPDLVPAHYGLGQALLEAGKYGEARAAFDRAIALQPTHAEAYCGRGNVCRALRQTDAAIAAFNQAIALNPRLAEAHCCLGNALVDQHRNEAAIAAFRQAIACNPGLAEAYDNLASLLADLGRNREALDCSRQLVRRFPDRAAYWQRFADRLRGWQFTTGDPPLLAEIQHCLERPGIDVQPLVPAALSLLAALPEFGALLAVWSAASPGELAAPSPAELKTLQHPVLLALLPRATIAEIGFERLLSRVRRTLLALATAKPQAGEILQLDLACALAQQCFLNEYVYPETPYELELIAELRRKDQPGVFDLAVLACYVPLGKSGIASVRGPTGAPADRLWRDLLRQQITEPVAEAAIAAELPALTATRDRVSLAVRQQYEQNPYPRWGETRPRPARSARQALRDMLPDIGAAGDAMPAAPEILIAGCGTGKQAIDAARRYADGRILAVDLSRASLAYGTRKARELGLDRIDFAQADIMELGGLERRFDLIECSGVLHHLGDPAAGWRILLGLLRPKGLMRVALYSELARRHVVAAQAYLGAQGYPATPEGIRAARQALLALPGDHPARPVTGYADFFTMSECRDLLFHVQEHRFTLPRLDLVMQELGLEFLGFELGDPRLRRAATEGIPAGTAAKSLANWHQFEIAHPDSFQGMYQFWVCRRDVR